ncbi:MAG: hypothetical protein OJF62_002014 [Pseudolabrys sp.]|nr:hypothetical protein [Pseudolabrys sp.]
MRDDGQACRKSCERFVEWMWASDCPTRQCAVLTNGAFHLNPYRF